jgi:hypothetical protein
MNQSFKGWDPGALDVVQEEQLFCPLYYSGKNCPPLKNL